ncbi:hypothetical protein BV25DRAFT_1145597 [Artomyces pyxidatus]|uniref:Uncharacterized protein n=1 Tax=Artomyces pyxidatus TaxID=48021 RepID=A0ACB8ST43_9AGAM|nr:hypothetical protein BV25DRAFT_1145597 [Artomyces pyxidatus]
MYGTRNALLMLLSPLVRLLLINANYIPVFSFGILVFRKHIYSAGGHHILPVRFSALSKIFEFPVYDLLRRIFIERRMRSSVFVHSILPYPVPPSSKRYNCTLIFSCEDLRCTEDMEIHTQIELSFRLETVLASCMQRTASSLEQHPLVCARTRLCRVTARLWHVSPPLSLTPKLAHLPPLYPHPPPPLRARETAS